MDNFELLDSLSEKVFSSGDYKMGSETKDSLEMLKSSGVLSRFVRERGGQWNHEGWTDLLKKISNLGYKDIG